MSRTRSLAAAACAAIATLVVGVPAAGARANPYTPQGVCGAGYGVVDQHALRDGGRLLGDVYLLYNGAAGKNCAVLIKRHRVGVPDFISVSIQVQGARRNKYDENLYKYYAGPRYVSARGKCVRWGGFTDLRAVGLNDSFLSPYGHCGV